MVGTRGEGKNSCVEGGSSNVNINFANNNLLNYVYTDNVKGGGTAWKPKSLLMHTCIGKR